MLQTQSNEDPNLRSWKTSTHNEAETSKSALMDRKSIEILIPQLRRLCLYILLLTMRACSDYNPFKLSPNCSRRFSDPSFQRVAKGGEDCISPPVRAEHHLVCLSPGTTCLSFGDSSTLWQFGLSFSARTVTDTRLDFWQNDYEQALMSMASTESQVPHL